MASPDIEYIRNNFDKENVLVLVDSSQRDRAAFPSPSQYAIDLSEPVRLVYGMDILDATIPNTQYNVDVANNLLCISTLDFAIDGLIEAGIAKMHEPFVPAGTTAYDVLVLNRIDPADQDAVRFFLLKTLYAELGKLDSYRSAVASEDPETKHVFFVHTPNNPFRGLDQADVAAMNLNFESPPTTVSYFRQTFDVPLDFFVTDAQGLIAAGRRMTSFVYESTTYWYDVDRDDALQVYIGQDVHNSVDQYFQSETTSVATIVRDYSFALYRGRTSYRLVYYKTLPCATCDGYSLAINNFAVRFPVGTYDFVSARTMLEQTIVDIPELSAVRVVNNMTTLKYSLKLDRPFFVDMARSTCGPVIGFDSYAAETGTGYRKVPFGGHNQQLFACVTQKAFAGRSGYNRFTLSSVYEVDTTLPGDVLSANFILEAPDVANLRGLPYIVLRCDEIENCIYRNFPFGKLGVGMFKFDTLNELTHLRFDFVNFVRKPFHPIGRVVRLSFRFETPTGELFDFKGNNYIMMVCLKCYVPKGLANFDRFTLNPNYNADFGKYMFHAGPSAAIGDAGYDSSDADDSGDEYDVERGMPPWKYAEMVQRFGAPRLDGSSS